MAEGQNLKHCSVCGGELEHTPKLGEFIGHERCHDAVMSYFRQGYRSALAWVRTAVDQERDEMMKDLARD